MGALAIANTIVLALVLILVVGLLRSHAAILRQLHELDGSSAHAHDDPGPAPVRLADPTNRAKPLQGVTLGGEQVVFAVSGVDHNTLLVFLSSSCLTCREFWSTFATDGVTLPHGTRLIIVTKDLSDESPSELAALAPEGFELVCSSAAWTNYQVPGSPYVISIDGSTGRIQGEGTGLNWEQVAGLLAQATGDRHFLTGTEADTVRKPMSDVAREARVDQELLEAGILPGDPSLYPEQETAP